MNGSVRVLACGLSLLVFVSVARGASAEDAATAPPAPEAAVSDDAVPDDAEMNRIAGYFGLEFTDALVESLLFADGSPMHRIPAQKHACVKDVFKDELGKAQAQSLRASLPKRSDVAAFDRFALTDGGRKLLEAFRLSHQDVIAGRTQSKHFKTMEEGLSEREHEEITRFLASPQGVIFDAPPKIGQPVGGMEAFARRLARECQVN